MRFAMKNGQICFSLQKFLAISSALQKNASDCGCDAVVHLGLTSLSMICSVAHAILLGVLVIRYLSKTNLFPRIDDMNGQRMMLLVPNTRSGAHELGQLIKY